MTPASTAIDGAIQQIRTYVAGRPHSADTLEGIAQWWLGGQFPREAIEAALGGRQLWRRQPMPG
ncbi:hypothetical protein [Janthinobacterium sp.]|uniref:hypothetical protein n=1 Tax=Janthinobacterium sp. TaxID=1871054 RepID=UPI00258FAFF7|nr:hypothetical protein [Janthinobacterium sp.]MCX7290870.1 hypothetical protein [Janthinobacterium sp.]